jgi:hypothetical protein
MLSTRQNIYHRGVIGDVDDSLSVMWAQVWIAWTSVRVS